MSFLKIITMFLFVFLFISCSEKKVAEVDFEELSSSELGWNNSSSNELFLSSSSLELISSSIMDVGSSSSIEQISSSSVDLLISSSTLPVSSSTLVENSSSSEEAFSSSEGGSNHSSSFEPFSSSSWWSSSSLAVYRPGDFILGADISIFQEYESRGVSFYDTDREKKSIFQILKNHGINFIRLKTFVDPAAMYGYAAPGCGETSKEAFGDKAHIMEYAKKIKEEGMGFLLDIHYSDTWADPAKQIIPERWRFINSIQTLSDSVYAYTYDVLSSLKRMDALPEMVQVGNEITDGILRSLPTSSTNCWGEPSTDAPSAISGQLSRYPDNFAKIINAGIKAVHDVDPNIKTVLHIENAVKHGSWWLGEVIGKQKIQFDILAFSAYTSYGHGNASDWKKFITTESAKYPNIRFLIAEYNGGIAASTWTSGKTKEINFMLKETPKAIGSFYWEPALYGEWGGAAFEWQGNNLYAIPSAFSEFDEVKSSLRLEPKPKQQKCRK